MTQQGKNHSFKYYLLHETTPVRVTFNDKRLKIGAEAPNADAQKLVIDHTLLSKIATDHEVQDIDEQTFDKLCADVYAKKKTVGRTI